MIDPLNIFCPCYVQDTYKNNKPFIQCTSCKKYQHKSCMKSMIRMPHYQCPYCQLKKGALFFNNLYSLIDPSLVEFNPIKKILNIWLTFIPDSSVYSTFSKKYHDSPMAIIIRCLRLDSNGFSFHWPKMSKIYLNDKIILDLTEKGYKKKDRMIALVPGKDYNNNIQKKFFLYDSNIIKNEDYLIEKKPNRFEIEINSNDPEKIEYTNFLISIELCEIYKEAEPIIDNIPIIFSKNEIKKILINNETENTILPIKEKVSLLDIYTDTNKIEIPARGVNCSHLNVFDLKTFLVINRKTNKYQCPYCKRYSNDLYIDGILYNFLKNPDNENIDEIYIDKKFNISIYEKESENVSESNNSNSNEETCKTELNKKIEKCKIKEDSISNHINKYSKRNNFNNNLIRIEEGDSENDINVNENDFNNSNCNIISDLGHMFDRIREDILSDKKISSSKNKKSKKIKRNENDIDNSIPDNHKLKSTSKSKLVMIKKKHELALKKSVSRKRKRSFSIDEGTF